MLWSVACVLTGCRGRQPAARKPSAALRGVEVPTLNEMRQECDSLKTQAQTQPANPLLNGEYANLRLYLRKADLFLRSPTLPEYALPMLYREIMHAKDALRSVRGGKLPSPSLGIREEAHYVDNDGSYEPFLRYLPSAARTGRPLPLIVFLHGYSPDQNLLNWPGIEGQLLQLAEELGFAIVRPFARSNTDFQAIGEQDVLGAIKAMQKRYPIDPDRIILAGYSMGGLGAWSIAAHHPHIFAGVFIVAGRGDYYFWHGLRRDELPIHKQRFADTEFAAPLIGNLRHLPFLVFHGSFDTLVPTDEARHIVRVAREAGVPVDYVEVPDGSHWILEQVLARPDVRAWFGSRRRSVPVDFEYTTYDPRFTRAHWLRLDGFRPTLAPARVAVQSVDSQLVIQAHGVRRVTVLREELPPYARTWPITGDGEFSLDVLEPGMPAPPLPAQRGPLRSAFLSSFVFVQAGLPPGQDAMRQFQSAIMAWYRYSKALPRMTYESVLTKKDRLEHNVFLFGKPEDSALMREVLQSSPIQITKDAYVIGRHSFPRRGNGLYLVYRSPWNDARLAVLQSGISWGARVPENHHYDVVPDFIVYTSRSGRDGSNTALCAGFFDENWQLADALTHVRDESRR